MAKVTFELSDIETDDGTQKSELTMDIHMDDPDAPASQSMMFALTIKRLFEDGRLAELVPEVCADVPLFNQKGANLGQPTNVD